MDKMNAFPEDDVETHSDKMANLTFSGKLANRPREEPH